MLKALSKKAKMIMTMIICDLQLPREPHQCRLLQLNAGVHGALGCDQKKLYTSVEVTPAPVLVHSKRLLVPSFT